MISLMISLVLVSMVSAFSFREFFDKITGKAAFSISRNNCTESDGGLNYIVLGNLTMCNRLSCKAYADSCTGNSKSIIERYCLKNNMATKVYKCPAGCKNGACVTNQTCTDSDGGLNYYVKGTTQDSTTTKTDNCWNDNITISEYYCVNDTAKQINDNWTKGCGNGAFINQTIISNSTI